MKFSIKSVVVAASLSLTASSMLLADGPKFSGYFEPTYNFNFNRPPSLTQRGRSFDTQTNTFALNAFQLQATGGLGDSCGYVGKLLLGTDANVIKDANGPAAAAGTQGSGSGTDAEIEEGYLWYKAPIGSGLTITAGKFVTFEGIEVIEGKDDYTISRGYLFGLAEPFTHTGIKADYQFIKQVDLAMGVVNGWDSLTDHNRGKTFIGRLGINLGDPFSGGISWTYGAEKNVFATGFANQPSQDDKRTSLDATFATTFNKWVTLAYQANYGEEANANAFPEGTNPVNPPFTSYATWFGFALEPKVTLTDKFWIGGRYEYFEDKDGARTGPAFARTNALQNVTIAPAYKLTDAVTFQTELRYDWGNQPYFEQKDAPAFNANAANQATVSAKFDYVF